MAVIEGSYEVESGFNTTLKSSISATQTSGIVVNKVLTITKGVLNFDAETAREEWVGFGDITDNGDGTCTLVDVTRGLPLVANDFVGASTRAYPHSGGTCKVILVDYHALLNKKANVDRENTFTADQAIGTGKLLKFQDTDVTLRRVGGELYLKSLDQAEVSLSTLASASGVNDKVKTSSADTTEGYLNDKIVAGDGLKKAIVDPSAAETLDLDIDLADTTIFSLTGEAGKVPLGGAGGKFDSSWVDASTVLENSAVAGEGLTTKEALAYNSKMALIKADANDSTLNPAYLFAGIANADTSVGETATYVPSGPVVEVPTFSMADRVNARLYTGTTGGGVVITTDAQTASNQWRAQTFIPQAGEDNIGSVTVHLTKTGSPTGTATLRIRATDSGAPTGADLGTATLTVADTITGANEFVFATPVAVTPGEKYAILLDPGVGMSGPANIAWGYDNGAPYADGSRFYSSDSGANWTEDLNSDYYFLVKYRGVAGEDVFLSDTAGELGLKEGTRFTRVGKAVSGSLLKLEDQLSQIYGTFTTTVNFNVNAVVYTDITIGFRPSRVFYTFYIGGREVTVDATLNSLGMVGNGTWTPSGSAMGRVLYRLHGASTALATPREALCAGTLFNGIVGATTFASSTIYLTLGLTVLDGNRLRFARTVTRQANADNPGSLTYTMYFVAER